MAYEYPGHLCAAKNVDAVLICSPDDWHLTHIQSALSAGKHVFCEKPLLVPEQNISALVALFAIARECGLVLTTCHPRRNDEPFLWLKDQLLRSIGEFGSVLSFSFDFSYHKPSNEWKTARSLLLDHVNHEVDLMNFLFGLQGFGAMKLHDGFDRYDVVGKRDDGVTFHFQGTRRLDAGIYPEWCRVRFERGEIELDMMRGVARIIDHEERDVEVVPNLAIDYDGRLCGVMTDFAQEIDGEPGYLSIPEMLMNTEAGIILQQEGWQRVEIRR